MLDQCRMHLIWIITQDLTYRQPHFNVGHRLESDEPLGVLLFGAPKSRSKAIHHQGLDTLINNPRGVVNFTTLLSTKGGGQIVPSNQFLPKPVHPN